MPDKGVTEEENIWGSNDIKELRKPIKKLEVKYAEIIVLFFYNLNVFCLGQMEIGTGFSTGKGFGEAAHRLVQLLHKCGHQEDRPGQRQGNERR